MLSFVRRFRHVATGVVFATFVSLPVVAEDSEIYVNRGTTKEGQPNILFVIDTSGSMNTEVPNQDGKDRITIVREAALGFANTLRNVNFGLMRYDQNSQGGFVLQPVSDIEVPAHRQAVIETLEGLQNPEDEDAPQIIDGFTPLSETYYEAYLYYTGGKVDYGTQSIDTSRRADDPTTYRSPITNQCQKNYVVYLTDGLPTRDVGANVAERIPRVTGATCPTDDTDANHGACMDELAAFMSPEDRDLLDTVDGLQNIQTYMIGFGPDVASDGFFSLDAVAAAGGTNVAYLASDPSSLNEALGDIFDELITDRATFVTPTVSVDAFNRAQANNELFFSLFKATGRTHWAGNLKKYQILNGQIADAAGNPAIVGGFFDGNALSFWTPAGDPDGAEVEEGGAVSEMLEPTTTNRRIYTSLSSPNLSEQANWLVINEDDAVGPNGFLTDAIVGTGTLTDTCTDACKEAVYWARGYNVNTPAPDTTDFVQKLGDPLHGQPAVVVYGNYDPDNDPPDTHVFMPTNDGMLHAFNGNTGEELWAYIPTEMLARLGELRADAPTATRTFGLDGDVRVLRLDKNLNGKIEYNAGNAALSDRVWLFFGMRSGGNRYYAVDVTQPTAPKLMWSIGPDQLPGVGLTWSAPVITRVNVGGANANDDDEKFVLIFGGGYDYAQENQPYSTDATGNRIFMVDAKSGDLLWSAGAADADAPEGTPTPSLTLTDMNNAIPSRVTVLDQNGDTFADRMYVGDMGGRIWRFDVINGQAAATLVQGGVFAELGNGGSGSPTNENNRRFYNAPDVALVQKRGEPPYYNIAIGSGYRGHPLDRTTLERFYSLRDMNPFAVISQDDYDDRTFGVIQESDPNLVEVSNNPAGSTVTTASKGWKYTFNRNGRGEKVLAEATTIDGVVLFPTYEPVDPGPANPCAPTSINRVYALTAFAGKPAINFQDEAEEDEDLGNEDVFTQLGQQGIVGAINVALLRGGGGGGTPTAPRTVCLAGVEVLSRCIDVGGTVRTYWNRNDVP